MYLVLPWSLHCRIGFAEKSINVNLSEAERWLNVAELLLNSAICRDSPI